MPLAQALVELSLPVVVADSWREAEGGPGGAGLDGILGDEQLKSAVATVDNLDTPDGPSTRSRAGRGQGVIRHYGFGTGADRPVPEWWDV